MPEERDFSFGECKLYCLGSSFPYMADNYFKYGCITVCTDRSSCADIICYFCAAAVLRNLQYIDCSIKGHLQLAYELY